MRGKPGIACSEEKVMLEPPCYRGEFPPWGRSNSRAKIKPQPPSVLAGSQTRMAEGQPVRRSGLQTSENVNSEQLPPQIEYHLDSNLQDTRP